MIRPVEFNGMLQRTDDVSTIKHQEDAKPLVDQQNIQVAMEQKEDQQTHDVSDPNQSDQAKNDADARDEGKGTYFDNRKKKEKKEPDDRLPSGKIVKKIEGGGFDIKI